MLWAVGDDVDSRVRAAAMAWLDQRPAPDDPVRRTDLLGGFAFEGRTFPLIDNQLGIRKPRQLRAALSIMTTYTPGRRPVPYEDTIGPDRLLRYKYQGTDPDLYTNAGLRNAMRLELPLIWFVGVQPGMYLPIYPVWIAGDEPDRLQAVVALNEDQRHFADHHVPTEVEREYAERITMQRLHQPVFRQRVLLAYETSCAMCRLRHRSLLDAAHIVGDREERGIAAVSNGLALCKIHHAAYDDHILGVRPDFVVEVRTDILREIDGPMLKHGLQEMHGQRLVVPSRRADHPDRDLLAESYERFRAVG